MKRNAILLIVSFTLLGAGPALAESSCQVPEAEWQTQAALQQKLEGEGWTIRQIKIDEGCYEVYGTNAQGERVEAYFDPKSLALLSSD